MQNVSEIIIRHEDALSRLATVVPAPNSHYVPDVVQTLSQIKLCSVTYRTLEDGRLTEDSPTADALEDSTLEFVVHDLAFA